MRRSSGGQSREGSPVGMLRLELEREIVSGRCAYCRKPAEAGRLTREHVIPRARGGARRDVRIIVPACAPCNRARGCRDLIPFLLIQPERISCLLDYLAGLSPTSIRGVDLRIFAELYTAIAILGDASETACHCRSGTGRICRGRALHRRRNAARRAIRTVAGRIEALKNGHGCEEGPTCILPGPHACFHPTSLPEPVDRLASRLLGLLSLSWGITADTIEHEIRDAASGTAIGRSPLLPSERAIEDERVDRNPDRHTPSRRSERTHRQRRHADRRRANGVRSTRAGLSIGRTTA